MSDIAKIQEALQPLFPGLMGIVLTGVSQERVTASLVVRPDLCATANSIHGGALMAFADTLGAVVTLTQLVIAA